MKKYTICLDNELIGYIRQLLIKYRAESAIVFGSYARGEATITSDIDIIVIGGKDFQRTDIFALGEDLRNLTGKDVDAFEISELDKDTSFYNNVMQEGIKVA